MKNDRAKRDLRDIAVAAREAWPQLSFEDDAFLEFLRAQPLRLALASVKRAGDLLLAFGCARGDGEAVRIVEREYFAQLEAVLLARHLGDPAEVVQVLRERVLVPTGGKPARIEGYTGRGALESWLRVAALRVALNLQRTHRREVSLDEDRALAERAGVDPEIADLKRRYRAEFREAFSAALRALSPRHRTLLRQHYLDGLAMETIAGLHRVHRLTVVRWMETARVALAAETRRELGSRLRIDRRELESILRLIDSQMEMSVREFLENE
jgi:RNA polymerase sigma-70 factor (ECF subfamily)